MRPNTIIAHPNYALNYTYYALNYKLCAKLQIMRQNCMCVMRQKPNYALKSKLRVFLRDRVIV